MTEILTAVDVVPLCLVNGGLQLVLSKRPVAPFAGVWALPSGAIDTASDNHTRDTALRLLREQLGVEEAYVE